MLVIGITGGIGTGKSTVSKFFELLGIPVFYADTEAKQLMQHDLTLIAKIKSEFGEQAYFANQELNRAYIAQLVFNNQDQLNRLNALVHPAVYGAFDLWLSKQNSVYVIKEAALLFESGSYIQNDYNILVSSPLALRLARVMKRDRVTEEQVLARIQAQFTEEQKLNLADFTIQNNEQELLIPQVLMLHQTILIKAETK
jgi:dephospho-CoA kinase